MQRKVQIFSDAAVPLESFGYDGEPVILMEDITADLVVEAWPAIGQAAVQNAIDFVPDELRAMLLDPKSCLLPLHEWPERAPVEKLVRAAHERGMRFSRMEVAGQS